jgi:hypothetical protein
MTANAKTLAHSQTLIIELVESLIHQVEAPLEVAKLEGDAIFLFCRKPADPARWQAIRADISRKLLEFFQGFCDKLALLGRSNTCTCHSCTHLEKLRLKVVVHSGMVLFHRVLQFEELAGTDVIIVHRLLKNSVQSGQYLLLTEAAQRELDFPGTITFKSGSEKYDGLGTIRTAVHDLDSISATPKAKTTVSTFSVRYRESFRLYLKLWLAPFAGERRFVNLPDGPSRARMLGFAAFTALLTPLFVAVAAVLIIFHARKSAG